MAPKKFPIRVPVVPEYDSDVDENEDVLDQNPEYVVRMLTNKKLSDLFTKKLCSDDLSSRKFTCLLCKLKGEKKILTKAEGHGSTWYTQHFYKFHPEFVANEEIKPNPQIYSERAHQLYKLICYFVNKNIPLSHFEYEEFQDVCTFPRTSARTLRKHILALSKDIKKKITALLPPDFGLMLDGWTESHMHYLAVFAVGKGVPNGEQVMLAFSPFKQKDDLLAAQHAHFFRARLNTISVPPPTCCICLVTIVL